MSSKMVAKFEKYWYVIHGIMGIAIVLDLRYKLKLSKHVVPKLYGNSSFVEINNIQKLCYTLFEDYQAKSMVSLEGSVEKDNDKNQNLDDVNINNPFIGYDSFINDSLDTQSKAKLDLYFEEQALPRSGTFDILGWRTTSA